MVLVQAQRWYTIVHQTLTQPEHIYSAYYTEGSYTIFPHIISWGNSVSLRISTKVSYYSLTNFAARSKRPIRHKAVTNANIKDPSMIIFRALGKVLYCKRDESWAECENLLPLHLRHHARKQMQFSPEQVICDEMGVPSSTPDISFHLWARSKINSAGCAECHLYRARGCNQKNSYRCTLGNTESKTQQVNFCKPLTLIRVPVNRLHWSGYLQGTCMPLTLIRVPACPLHWSGYLHALTLIRVPAGCRTLIRLRR